MAEGTHGRSPDYARARLFSYNTKDDFMPYLEGLARIDVRLFVSMLGEAGQHSAEDLLPAVEVAP